MVAWFIIFIILFVLSFEDFRLGNDIVRLCRVSLTLMVLGTAALYLIGPPYA